MNRRAEKRSAFRHGSGKDGIANNPRVGRGAESCPGEGAVRIEFGGMRCAFPPCTRCRGSLPQAEIGEDHIEQIPEVGPPADMAEAVPRRRMVSACAEQTAPGELRWFRRIHLLLKATTID